MIFIDSNIPMYLIGANHPNKTIAHQILERHVHLQERFVTDAEVLQEILHRYFAIGRTDAIQPAFDALLGIVDEVVPVDLKIVERAKTILLGKKRISARDALHIAIMEEHGIDRVMSFDAGFDGVPGITRIHA